VNTVSAAHMGNFGQTNYSGAKGAIASMTYTCAFELARSGIRVNAVSPSGTTRMSAQAKLPGGKVAEGLFLDPTLNGPFVAWLCSDDANWVTGQIFGIGAERVVILEQPRYGTAMFQPGGWSVEALRTQMKAFFGNRLEPFGLGAAFLEGAPGSDPEALAARLRQRVGEETGLPLRVGIATGKFLARLAAEEAGAGGVRQVAPGTEAEFLAPLAMTRLEGVGRKTAAILAELGARTIGDVARLGRDRLEEAFGTHGLRIFSLASTLSRRAFSTLSIFPNIGRIAW